MMSIFLALSKNRFRLEERIGPIFPVGLALLRPALQPRLEGILVNIPRSTEQRHRPEGQQFGEIDDEIAFKNERAYSLAIPT